MLANCAALHIPPAEAKRLTWWEYQALVWESQPEDADEAPEAPDPEFVARRQQKLADKGLLRMVH